MAAHGFTSGLLEHIKQTSEQVETLYDEMSDFEITDELIKQSLNPAPFGETYKAFVIPELEIGELTESCQLILESNRQQLMVAELRLFAKSKLLRGSLGPQLMKAVKRSFDRTDIDVDRGKKLDQLYNGSYPYMHKGLWYIDGANYQFRFRPWNRFDMAVRHKEMDKKPIVSIFIHDPAVFRAE